MPTENIGQFVDISITVDANTVAPRSFGTPIVVGQHTRFAELFRVYTSLDGMVDDGFLTTDQEYLHAAALIANTNASGRRFREGFVIGRRAAAVAQVYTGTVAFGAGSTYTIQISRVGMATQTVAVPANTDTATTRDDIVTALNGDADIAAVVTAAPSGGAAFTITSDTAGVAFTVTVSVAGGSGTLSGSVTTANVGIAEDMAAIVAANAEFYAIALTSRSRTDITQLAAWVESQTRPYIAICQSGDAGLLSAAYDAAQIYADVGSELKGLARNRTALLYHAVAAEPLDAALMALVLPASPGTITWANKSPVGITVDDLTATQQLYLSGTPTNPTSGKNVTMFIPAHANRNLTLRGLMASGRDIELQRVVDQVRSNSEIAAIELLALNEKIAMSPEGIGLIKAAIDGVFNTKKAEGVFLDFSTSQPSLSDITAANRANGVLSPGITGQAVFANALKYVTASLTVAV